ncbi:4-hydroxyphenylacetate 3-monooxygenase reductase subunit [Calidithermus timidus]|jgi:flavin reductase (NADH)|uniref:4-hydroxyphenylacetate 3-monooxygenase reductase subunit n=1 Tax=Calidithermus timidus TaxID=307124 RepID=UPI00035FB2AD|nr:4-hydroxyphenylacetate 3-monooxygenase reductase subunit [Calidithermus timidus]
MEIAQPTLTELFKSALARWASGVSVVAAEAAGERRGMTASSFSSLSLRPPLVLVCIDEGANLLGLLERSQRFVINLLAEGQQAVSNHFAGRPGTNLDFEPLNPDLSIEGALATLYCSKWQLYPGGDHRIVVGQVEAVRLGKAEKPLVYWNRAYHSLR